MSAIKKTSAKSNVKESKASAKPASKETVKALSKTESATAAIVAAVTRAAAPVMAQPVAPVKTAAVKAVVTTISARVDVGFGNTLFVRGEGPGLSWDQGVAMTNLGSDLWQLQLGGSARPFVFKFLVNDTTWSTGADFSLTSGSSEAFSPQF